MPKSRIEQLCLAKNLRMTHQRRVVARVLSASDGHPDVEEVYKQAIEMDAEISIATIYRTLRMFEEAGILERHDFGGGRARYEEATDDHHDHLIDVTTGAVIEFQNEEIEALQEKIARDHGMQLIDHRLELYGRPIEVPSEEDTGD